jgi:hypothetical protein
MPRKKQNVTRYIMRKIRNKDGYKVYHKTTKKVYAKFATKDNAKKQVRLLNAIEHNAAFKKQIRNSAKNNRK